MTAGRKGTPCRVLAPQGVPLLEGPSRAEVVAVVGVADGIYDDRGDDGGGGDGRDSEVCEKGEVMEREKRTGDRLEGESFHGFF